MPTRHPNDFNHVTEWTDSIIEIPNTTSFIKSKGLFNANFTDQEAILFDRIESDYTLLPSTNRRGGQPTYGKGRSVKTFSLPLSYFHHMDNITKQDYKGKRKAGTTDQEKTEADVLFEKLEDARRVIDQTHEYMQLQAIKGSCKTPDGVVLADMFSEFSLSQTTIYFDLGNSSANIKAKLAALKDAVVKNLKTGGVVRAPLEVIVDRTFFNAFVMHANVVDKYMNSTSNIQYQKDLSTYYTWGISDMFEMDGVRFLVYEYTFNLPDGTTEVAIASNSGHVIPQTGGKSIYQAYYGPSQRMDSNGGSEMFAWEFMDPKGRYRELEFETAPLFICTKPATLVKVSGAAS